MESPADVTDVPLKLTVLGALPLAFMVGLMASIRGAAKVPEAATGSGEFGSSAAPTKRNQR